VNNFVIVSISRQCHGRDAQVGLLGTHQAASHIPALYLPSRSQYSFTDPERMEGWVSPGPGCKEQLAHGCYATACGQLDSNLRPRGRRSNTLSTRLSRQPKVLSAEIDWNKWATERHLPVLTATRHKWMHPAWQQTADGIFWSFTG